MARIYDRDNIQYAPMIQQAIANSRAAGEKRAQYQKNKYDIANQLVQAGGRTLQSYASDDPDNEGWTSYILTGDRSALEAARNRAQQQQMQEAQFAQQKAMQEAQQAHALDLQAKQIASTEKIAEMNRATQKAYDDLEAEKKYEDATINYQSAVTALSKDPNNDDLKRAKALAEANLELWTKRTGRGTQQPAETEVQAGNDGFDNQTEVKLAKPGSGKWTDKARDEATAHANKIQDDEARALALKEIEDKGPTKEDKDRAEAAEKKKAEDYYAKYGKSMPGWKPDRRGGKYVGQVRRKKR